MKVSMVLTMLDKATPQLRKFVDALEGLQGLSDSVNESMKVLQDGIGGVAVTVSDAIAPLREWNTAARKSVASTDALADSAATLDGAIETATGTLSGLGAALGRFDEIIGTLNGGLLALAERLQALSVNAEAAEGGMEAMGGAAAHGLAEAGDAAEAANAKMSGLRSTMKGMIELWGAWKMGEGMKRSVEVAADYQQRVLQMRNMGIPQSEQATMRADARKWSQIPGVSKLTALEAANAAIAGAPGAGAYQQMMRQQLMPTILRGAVALKTTYGDKNSIHDIVRNALGIVETRGKIQNLPAAIKAVQTAFRVIEGTEGKIKMLDMETALRNTGYGEALRYSTRGFYNIESLHEQFKASGKAGGAGGNTKASTIATMVASMLLGGKMNKPEAMMLEQLGLLNPADVRKISGSSQTFVNPKGIPGAAEGLRNPVQWLRDTFDPHLLALMQKQNPGARGVPLRNAVMQWAASFAKTAGGVNIGTGLITTMDNEQWTAVRQRASMMAHSASIGTASHRAAGTLVNQMVRLHAAMETVAQQIGSMLLPAVTKLAQWATEAARAVAFLNHQFPVFKKIEAWVGALVALMLGIKGVEWLLGLKQGFLSLRTVVKAVAPAVSGAVTGIGGLVAEFGAFPVAAAAALAAGIGYAIGHILNMVINKATAYFTGGKSHSLGGWLARELHPLPQVHYAAPHGPIVNTAVAKHQGALESRAKAINPATLGYEGPVTAQGVAKAHALHAKVAHAHAVAQSHLQALSAMIHAQWLGIHSPTAGKIAAIRTKYGAYQSTFATHAMFPQALMAHQVEQHQVLSLRYNQAMGHLGTAKAHLHNQLTANAALVTAGALTKMQAAQRAIQLQKSAAPAMIQMADAARRYAQAMSNPKLVSALDAQIAKLKAMGAQLSYYGQRIHQVTQNAFAGLINNLMHGRQTWGQMILGFFNSIANGIDKTISQAIAQSISNGLIHAKKSGQMGGLIGSMMQTLGSAASSSGGSSSAHAASSSGAGGSSGGFWGSLVQFAATHLSSFAVGTNYVPHDMVANIHKGEMIVPSGVASEIRSGGGGGAPTVNMHVSTIDSTSFVGHLSKVKRELATMVSSTQRQYNMSTG